MEYIVSFLFVLVLKSQHLFLLSFKEFPQNHMFVGEL